MRIEAPLLTLGQEPEPSFLEGGNLMVKISVAENHSKNTGDRDNPVWERTGTSWYNMVAFGDTAEKILNELDKGDAIRLLSGIHKKKNIGTEEEPDIVDQYIIFKYEKYERDD